ncbi:hypothetical protein H5410_005659 [Solanum commersonii]|uniref:Uncharacterized protein n=1 Tax=Solanum commersonii TaxID=4109 RepID=A0A9J6A7D7_SOLCO|nr:hypothetical protein H5410_005659 [Solanum commersonii]
MVNTIFSSFFVPNVLEIFESSTLYYLNLLKHHHILAKIFNSFWFFSIFIVSLFIEISFKIRFYNRCNGGSIVEI